MIRPYVRVHAVDIHTGRYIRSRKRPPASPVSTRYVRLVFLHNFLLSLLPLFLSLSLTLPICLTFSLSLSLSIYLSLSISIYLSLPLFLPLFLSLSSSVSSASFLSLFACFYLTHTHSSLLLFSSSHIFSYLSNTFKLVLALNNMTNTFLL